MKSCIRCGVAKPPEDFSIAQRSKGRDRRFNICRICKIAYDRSTSRREKATVAARARSGAPEFKQRERAKKSAYRERHPQKAYAKRVVREALAAGTLVRPTKCSHCGDTPASKINGSSRIQGHHADYSKPLEVTWLCEPCHGKEHRRYA